MKDIKKTVAGLSAAHLDTDIYMPLLPGIFRKAENPPSSYPLPD
jgi:hypothetical protein